MYPTLLLGSLALPTYPLLLLLSLWVGMAVSSHRAGQLALDGDHVYNAGLYGLLSGIIGARLWFVLSHWENYASDLGQALSLSRSALSAGEGLIVAGVVILVYLQRNKVPIGPFFDALAPGLAIAIVIGNVGAFLGGENLGAPSDVPWAIEMINATRHPIQLYEAVASLLIFGILYLARNRSPWPSFQFWVFVGLYGLSRLFLEIFRARPTFVGNGYLAVQIMALGAIVIALAVMAYKFSNDPAKVELEKHEVIG